MMCKKIMNHVMNLAVDNCITNNLSARFVTNLKLSTIHNQYISTCILFILHYIKKIRTIFSQKNFKKNLTFYSLMPIFFYIDNNNNV
jgi:hypothetical protein